MPLISTDKKEVADGCGLIKKKVKAIMVKQVQPDSAPSPRPPATAKTTAAATPMVPTPPKVPQTKRKGTRPGAFLIPAKAVSDAGKLIYTHPG